MLAEHVFDLHKKRDGQKRIAAKLEKIIRYADLRNAKRAVPNIR